MTRTRRSTYTALALAAGLLAASLLLAVAYRPREPTHAARGERRSGRNLPADLRALPPGSVERLGSARGKGLPGRTEVITAAYSADGNVIVAGYSPCSGVCSVRPGVWHRLRRGEARPGRGSR